MIGQIIAHRGACAYAPENTFGAFKQAKELGCHFIEFDVVQSQDNELFVFHDDELNRTSNGSGIFHESSTVYLRSLDAGSWFSPRFKDEKIPYLREVLNWLVTENVHANIELKPIGHQNDMAHQVLAQLKQIWPKDRALPLISSFNTDILKSCRTLDAHIPLGFLLHEWDDNACRIAQELKCYSMHLCKDIVSEERIYHIKKCDLKIYSYTINNSTTARRFFNWGMDGIFSDYPDLLL